MKLAVSAVQHLQGLAAIRAVPEIILGGCRHLFVLGGDILLTCPRGGGGLTCPGGQGIFDP